MTDELVRRVQVASLTAWQEAYWNGAWHVQITVRRHGSFQACSLEWFRPMLEVVS